MQSGNGGKGRVGAVLPVVVGVAVAAAVVIGYMYVQAPRATRIRVGDLAPDFTLPPPAGAPVRLSSTRGGPTLLFFFDSRKEGNESYVLALQRLNRRFAERGLTLIGVALDPDAQTVRAFMARVYVEFPILTDPFGAVLKTAYGPPRDPEAYLLDREGRVVSVFTQRIDWNTTEFIGRLEQELRAPAGR